MREFAQVLAGGDGLLGLGVLDHLVLGVLDAVALRDLVVLEVHLEEVRQVNQLLHVRLEVLDDVQQVEAVHIALDRLHLALLFVHLTDFQFLVYYHDKH